MSKKHPFIVTALFILVLAGLLVFRNRQAIAPEVEEELANNKVTSEVLSEEATPSTIPTMQKPEMTIDKTKKYSATLKTSEGDITVLLQADETPITVNNFVYLARAGFYNDTVFHRIIEDFMIQGGDPLGNGTGGPGYSFEDEPFTGEYERGVLAMANSGPDTNGSQFFIMHQTVGLQKDYVIFGKVTSGFETLDKIAETPVTKNQFGEASSPVSPISLISVEILEE